MIRNITESRNGLLVSTTNNEYAFHYLRGDVIKGGSKADIEGTVAYVGDNLGKHYIVSKDLDEVPEEVILTVKDHGLTLLDDVDGGWDSWDGRPEFSKTYVDITDATPATE